MRSQRELFFVFLVVFLSLLLLFSILFVVLFCCSLLGFVLLAGVSILFCHFVFLLVVVLCFLGAF